MVKAIALVYGVVIVVLFIMICSHPGTWFWVLEPRGTDSLEIILIIVGAINTIGIGKFSSNLLISCASLELLNWPQF